MILAAEPVCVCGCDVAAPLVVRCAGGATGKEQPLADFFRSFEKQLTAAEWASVRAAGPDDAAQEEQFRCGAWCC